MELPKNLNPKEIELKWYKIWEEKKLFSPGPEEGKKPFTIVIPPPNVTGALHMGHALNNTLQDVIIRYRRLKGENALWVPGTDHGGIATQNVVEKLLLKEEGKTRHQIGREEFVNRVWKWRQEAGDTILLQLRRLGCSLDWSRTRFTLDEVCSDAVIEAFIRLYNDGLVYRGKRMVNWCVRCNTALADIEVEHREEKSKLWYIRYPLGKVGSRKSEIGNKNINSGECAREFLVVATTRPETMLGDTAVAVNPKDTRYKGCMGKTVILPLTEREIPVIADELVELGFGTGVVKVTPAHDPVDHQIAKKHNLKSITVIDVNGKMTKDAGKNYEGLDRYECRKKVLNDLESFGLLEKTEDYLHSVGICYRCHSTIEPLVSDQWFIKMGEMAERAMGVAGDDWIDTLKDEVTQNKMELRNHPLTGNGKTKKVRFHPDSWTLPYLRWLGNLEDWCISRQIWWGHRLPVWYCRSCSKTTVSKTKPQRCQHCASTDIYQDPDVLDTWFSSALWPFSVFGWPKETDDLNYFYPTSVLVTGYEILYLWVARMIMMGLKFRNEIPFTDVYIHGIVRDIKGKKMSKSLGNVIDPLEVMDDYGTDALRFALTQSATPGRDIQLSFDSFVGGRNFSNKIWNASRFILMNVPAEKPTGSFENLKPEPMDKWIMFRFNETVKKVTDAFENYALSEAARALYNFFWFEFCDWYVELVKPRLSGDISDTSYRTAVDTLLKVHTGALKLLHPVMPFITEEIFQMVSETDKSIMVSDWPVYDEKIQFGEEVKEIEFIKDMINEIRILRSEMEVPAARKIEIMVQGDA
ncbi:MAG: valine--tRNA ligase, partial [Elusimicrobiota bacterium]